MSGERIVVRKEISDQWSVIRKWFVVSACVVLAFFPFTCEGEASVSFSVDIIRGFFSIVCAGLQA